MNIEIPTELLLPTIEELEDRTAKDLAKKWKPCKRPGKRERNAIKQEKEAVKLKAAVQSIDSLFDNGEKPKFSLSTANTTAAKTTLRPVLKVSLEKSSVNGIVTNILPSKTDETVTPQNRKRGRPPKIRPL
jgi:hypothetical protein